MEYLTRPEQYALVYAKGKSFASSPVVLRAMPNSLSVSRCGFSVGKRVGKAVIRNRVKRLMREIIRLTPLKPGWDLVLIARTPSATAGYKNLKEDVMGLLIRAGILGATSPVA